MNRYFLLALIFVFIGFNSVCFSQANRYSLKVKLSNIKSGYAKILIEGVCMNKDSAQHWTIEKGEATIGGVLPQPHPYIACIWLNDSIVTGNFVISPGRTQNLKLNDSEFGTLPLDTSFLGAQNKVLNERLAFIDRHETAAFYAQKKRFIQDVYHDNPPQNILDSFNILLDKISFKKDTTIKNFIVQNPNSYIGLLYLYSRVRIRGFSGELYSALNSLDKNIQGSDIGIKASSIFEKDKRVALGSSFPVLKLLDLNNKSVPYNLVQPSHAHPKLILIDFWYSNCGPCIAQFDRLKKMFRTYHNAGFDINSISTDSKANIEEWRTVIFKHSLPWKQYLDVNGENAKDLNINIFPFYFLIDEHGTILKKHISMVELEEILKREFQYS